MRRRTVADLLLDGFIVSLLAFGLLITLAVLYTPTLGPPADPLSTSAASPPWYLSPFYRLISLLSIGWGSLVIIGLSLIVFVAPFLDRSRPGSLRLIPRLIGLLLLGAIVWLGVHGAAGAQVQTPSERTPAPGQPQCLICHSEIKVDYVGSEHAKFDVTCTACHGGDPDTLEMEAAHDPAAGYRGAPSRQEIPLLCASCHASPTKMKPYGLPIDQYEEYLTSEHGRRWIAGDPRVAVCIDCHTAHRMLPAFDPRSAVNPVNVPATCGRCHNDPQYVKPYGLPSDQLAAYRQSVHGQALLEGGNSKAPSCADCHGSHGAAPPGVEDVSRVCGICHSMERSYFAAGPHKRAMDERRMSECVGCHGDHDIIAVEIGPNLGHLFDTTCTTCHASESEAVETGRKLKTLIVGAWQAVAQAEEALAHARARGYDVEPYASRMIEARAYLVQALPVQHTLDVSKVEDLTRRARSVAESVRSQAHALLGSQGFRLLGLALVWGFLAIVLVVALLYRRERHREREEG